MTGNKISPAPPVLKAATGEKPVVADPARSRTPPLALLGASILLLLMAWASHFLVKDIAGPLAIATGNGEITVLAPGRLMHLGTDGTLTSTDEDLIDPATRRGSLAWINDSLFASPGVERELLRCAGGECAAFSADTYAPTGPTAVYFDGNLYWFSETEADRIQRYDAAGKRIDMPLSDLVRPGSLHVAGDQLYVANAGESRIARYTLHKRGVDRPEDFATYRDEEDPSITDPVRFLPRTDGSFVAVFSDSEQKRGALVSVAADGSTERIDVEGLVNPVDVAALGADLLVVDEATMQVLKVAPDGSAEVFGDEETQEALSDGRLMRDVFRVVEPLAAILGVLLAGFSLSWLVGRSTQGEPEGARTVKPDSEGILWMPAECDLAPGRIPRYLMIVAPMALIPAVALAFAGQLVAAIGWAALLVLLAVAVPMRQAARVKLPPGERIGVRDRQFIVTHPEHGRREFALPAVEWSPQLLRPEAGRDIPLVRNGHALYHPPTLEALLFPRLNLMRRIPGS